MLKTAPVLSYFDDKKQLLIQADASQKGIAAVLMQEGRVVEYASRALTQSEVLYSQLKKRVIIHSFCDGTFSLLHICETSRRKERSSHLSIKKIAFRCAKENSTHVIEATELFN